MWETGFWDFLGVKSSHEELYCSLDNGEEIFFLTQKYFIRTFSWESSHFFYLLMINQDKNERGWNNFPRIFFRCVSHFLNTFELRNNSMDTILRFSLDPVNFPNKWNRLPYIILSLCCIILQISEPCAQRWMICIMFFQILSSVHS